MAEQVKRGPSPLFVFAALLSLMFAAGKVFAIGVTQTWSWWLVFSPVLFLWGLALTILLVVFVGVFIFALVKK